MNYVRWKPWVLGIIAKSSRTNNKCPSSTTKVSNVLFYIQCIQNKTFEMPHKRPRTRLWLTRNTSLKSYRGALVLNEIPWCSGGIGFPRVTLQMYNYDIHTLTICQFKSLYNMFYTMYSSAIHKSRNWTSACYLNMLFTWMFVHFGAVLVYVMAIRVVEFSNGGYRIRKIFA